MRAAGLLINSVVESSISLSYSSLSSSPVSEVSNDQIIVIIPGHNELFAINYNLSSSTHKTWSSFIDRCIPL